MQRLEPRELLRRDGAAVALAALLPVVWWWAARSGWVPDVLDHDAGAVAAVRSLRGAVGGAASFWPASPLGTMLAACLPFSPVVSVRITMALAAWAAGVGGWRLAHQWRPEGGTRWAALAGLAAQLGPWTIWPLHSGSVAGLAAGPVLLAFTLPWCAPLLALWSAPVAAILGIEGMISGSRWRRAAWIGCLVLLAPTSQQEGAALRVASESAPSAPAYVGADGAWFPLPPPEAAPWRASAAWFSGRWVHPLSQAVSGSTSRLLPPGALPLAIEAASVPATRRTVTPGAWLVAMLPEGRVSAWLRGGGLEGGAAAAAVLAAARFACRFADRTWLRRELAALAMLAGLAGFAVPKPAVGGVSGAELASLCELPGNVLFYPPPAAPWLAGRWSEAQVGGVAAAPVAPPRTVAALARLSDTSFDTAAAGLAWEARGEGDLLAVAAEEGVDTLVVDLAALPGWGRARLERSVGEAAANRGGDLLVVSITPRSP